MIKSVYIHIPFCISKCKYCSFVSGENIENKQIYLEALLKEIKTRYKGEYLKTLYFGGGTPSLLNFEDIFQLIKCFNYENNPEITIEVNPDTVTKEKFIGYKNIGINRVSVGIQTFDNDILKEIGRTHSQEQAQNAIEIIKKVGFNNISIDLIYGLPNQTFKKFEYDLKIAKKLNIQHISSYGLKIENGSIFYKNRPKNIPNDDMQAKMYEYLCEYLSEYNHYEISNYALRGFESEHNCVYWRNQEYYGFGVNASGYENNIRYKNISKLKEYIKNPLKREETILLTQNETVENEIILALRLKTGININEINKKYNFDFLTQYGEIVKKYEQLGLLSYQNNTVALTKKGILLSNEVMSEFL